MPEPGGATWTESELTDGIAVVGAPEGASAIDTAGGTTTETVTDAYLVQRPGTWQ